MVGEVVFINKFLWDVGYFDVHILWLIHRGHEVEKFDIKSCKLHISTKENAIDD